MPKADSSRVRAAGLHQPYCAKPEVYVAREEPSGRLLEVVFPGALGWVRSASLGYCQRP